VTAVLLGRRRCAENRDHVVGRYARTRSRSGAVDQNPPSVRRSCFGATDREPEFGSLMRWRNRLRRGRCAAGCPLMCSGAYFKSTGPLCRSATKKRRVGALATRISSSPHSARGSARAAIFLRPGHAEPCRVRRRRENSGASGVFTMGLWGSRCRRRFPRQEGTHCLRQPRIRRQGGSDRNEGLRSSF